MPQGTRQLFNKYTSYDAAMAAIVSHHAPVSAYFHTGVGMELMFQESEILVSVLLALKDEGIVALPIHDSVLVPSSAAPRAKQIMESVFLEHAGAVADVRIQN